MDLSFTPDQEALRRDARALLEQRCPPARVRSLAADERGFCSALWDEMGQRGWLRLGVAADARTNGARLLDRVLLFEELGRASTPGPFLAHYEALMALEELGMPAVFERLGTGRLRASLALLEESGSPALQSLSLRADKGPRLSGKKLFVPWAADSEVLCVVARGETSALGLFAVEAATPQVRARRLASLDSERVFEVDFYEAPAELLAITTGTDAGATLERALAKATILACAELAGAAAAALEYAVDYVGRREQFGRPIGSFQAIQHHCANMALDADAAHLAVMDAAARVDAGDEPGLIASHAKVICSEAARRVTTTAHQVLGGIGFLEDSDMHLWTRRVKVLESRLGTPDWHRERIADALALPG